MQTCMHKLLATQIQGQVQRGGAGGWGVGQWGPGQSTLFSSTAPDSKAINGSLHPSKPKFASILKGWVTSSHLFTFFKNVINRKVSLVQSRRKKPQLFEYKMGNKWLRWQVFRTFGASGAKVPHWDWSQKPLVMLTSQGSPSQTVPCPPSAAWLSNGRESPEWVWQTQFPPSPGKGLWSVAYQRPEPTQSYMAFS